MIMKRDDRVQHRDQIRHRRDPPSAIERRQVLILLLEAERPARVLTEALDNHRAVSEPASGPPLDVP
jgi:hypothetical protein